MAGRLLVLDDAGRYVPSDGSDTGNAGTAGNACTSATEQTLSLAANGGGSGTGMSYYSVAARCGRRARLDTERRAMYTAGDAPLPVTKNHFVVGSVYHRLQELARKGNDMPLIDLNERWQNPNVAEGVRLFKGWLRTWGRDFWGKCLGVEVQLTDTETFGVPVTAALDMVVEMDEEACVRARRRGLELQPGRYIVDWKSADGPSNGTSYAEGLQALWYCGVYNKFHPDAPVQGIIFDVVMKRSRRKDRSVLIDDFQAFFVPCGLEPIEALRGLVEQGHRNVLEDRPNRAECTSWQGDVCPYRMSGECDAQ